MTWFKEDARDNDIYDREIGIIRDERSDIEDRIKESRSLREQKAYKDLLTYLERIEDTLDIYFDKELKDNLKPKFKAFVKKQAKAIFSRTLNSIKSNLPEFLAGLVVSAGSMIFGIYELAMNMGKGIMEKSKAALKDLEKKIKEYADKQSEPIRAIMNMVGSLLGAGGDSLGFIMTHILAISLAIVAIIISYKYYYRSVSTRQRGPRVRVKYESE